MLKRFRRKTTNSQRETWRDYQQRQRQVIISNRNRSRRFKTGPLPASRLRLRLKPVTFNFAAARGFFLAAAAVSVVLAGCYYGWTSFKAARPEPAVAEQTPAAAQNLAVAPATPPAPKPKYATKDQIQQLLGDRPLYNLTDRTFEIQKEGRFYQMEASVNISLQQLLQKQLDRRNSRHIGIVTMDPATGRILAMVGYDKNDPATNPCLNNQFPAASIFKIITAAAAIEEKGYTPNTVLKFNGYKHTLYKNQLKERNNRYTNRVKFKDSFAQSINPVFGKIGALYLGREPLQNYATAFGFNRSVNFDQDLGPSRMDISEKPYHWAEIASGFNRDTTLSALHGAMIAAAVANNGIMVEPTIIDRVIDQSGKTIYRSRATAYQQAIKPQTSKALAALMQRTVRAGTCRGTFRGARKDAVLSRLEIGGKTGSIYNKGREARFDWFVGYAGEKKGPAKFAIAVVVAHQKYIGKRAAYYARLAIKHYFRDYYAQRKLKSET